MKWLATGYSVTQCQNQELNLGLLNPVPVPHWLVHSASDVQFGRARCTNNSDKFWSIIQNSGGSESFEVTHH